MKSYRTFLVFALLLLFSIPSNGQDLFLKYANRLYEQGKYEKAINVYKRVLTKDNVFDAKEKLANSYRLVGNYRQAEYWYGLVTQSSKAQPISMFYYAQILQFNKKYNEAKKAYLKFGETDPRGLEYAKKLDDIKTLEKPRSGVQVRPEMINTSFSESAPTFYKNGIVFSSDRTKKANNFFSEFFSNARSNDDLYFSKINERNALLSPVALEGMINSAAQEGQATFTADENMVYYTSMLSSLIPNVKPLLSIKFAMRNGINWETVNEFPLNSVSYSIGHPSISSDGNTLYFSSDMPDGYGGFDLYKVTRTGADWSVPENLGPSVNTAGDEFHPFIHESGRLFFSSNGHFGLGGFDIFYTDAVGDNWSTILNAGAPINSIADEKSFILDSSSRLGYLSTKRPTGYGGDDIFKVSLESPLPSAEPVRKPKKKPVAKKKKPRKKKKAKAAKVDIASSKKPVKRPNRPAGKKKANNSTKMSDKDDFYVVALPIVQNPDAYMYMLEDLGKVKVEASRKNPYLGGFHNKADAEMVLREVKERGLANAFVAGYNSLIFDPEEAEKDWKLDIESEKSTVTKIPESGTHYFVELPYIENPDAYEILIKGVAQIAIDEHPDGYMIYLAGIAKNLAEGKILKNKLAKMGLKSTTVVIYKDGKRSSKYNSLLATKSTDLAKPFENLDTKDVGAYNPDQFVKAGQTGSYKILLPIVDNIELIQFVLKDHGQMLQEVDEGRNNRLIMGYYPDMATAQRAKIEIADKGIKNTVVMRRDQIIASTETESATSTNTSTLSSPSSSGNFGKTIPDGYQLRLELPKVDNPEIFHFVLKPYGKVREEESLGIYTLGDFYSAEEAKHIQTKIQEIGITQASRIAVYKDGEKSNRSLQSLIN